MQRTSPAQLLALGAIGAYTLWGIAFLNGTVDRINAAVENGFMPDGRALRSTYTGNLTIDGQLKYLTVFYEVLSNGLTTGPRLLFFDLNFVLSSTCVWVFIESRRRGVTSLFLRHPIPFAILWNAMGAAFVQPIYFYAIAKSEATARDPTIPLNEAIALFVATIPTVLLFPLFLFAPSYLGWDTYEHHGFIAKFQGTPLLTVIIFVSTIAFMWPRFGLVSKKSAINPNEDKKWIVASYVAVSIIAAAVHIGVIIGCITSTELDISLTRLFVPSPGKVASLSTASGNVTVTASTLPVRYRKLMEGCHIFTQFDFIVVTISCVIFIHYLLSNQGRATNNVEEKVMSRSETKELACLVLGSVVLGPGAAGSLALAVRESRLRVVKVPGKCQ